MRKVCALRLALLCTNVPPAVSALVFFVRHPLLLKATMPLGR